MPVEAADPCPCSSGRSYRECCAPLHAGEPAPTAVALMRSRFTAFALGLEDYLLATWHPSTRPTSVELDAGTTWRRLQIVATLNGGTDDTAGVVEFRASFRTNDGAGLLHERSRFTRVARRWLYLDGDVSP